MREKRLTSRQVLARMRRGDMPQMVGAGGSTAVFDDGAKAGGQTMHRLEKEGHIDRPVGTSISCRWTLAAAAQQVEQVRERLSPERTRARAHVQLEAEQAGLDDTVAACVDAAMSAYDDLGHDAEAWEDLVAAVIQGHAAP